MVLKILKVKNELKKKNGHTVKYLITRLKPISFVSTIAKKGVESAEKTEAAYSAGGSSSRPSS